MSQHEYRIGEHIRFYLPTDNPQHVRPRAGIIVELMGVSVPGAPVYAVVPASQTMPAGAYATGAASSAGTPASRRSPNASNGVAPNHTMAATTMSIPI